MQTPPLSFSTAPHPEWDKKIARGLKNELKKLIGLHEDLKSHSIYALREDLFAGGIVLERHGEIVWIDSIWVEPDFRKKGVGEQLIQQALLWATHHKAKEIQLNTFFKDSHDFFLASGFEDVAAIPHWKYGLECYLMRKRL